MEKSLSDVLFYKKNTYIKINGSKEDEILNNCAEHLANGADIIEYYPIFDDKTSVITGKKIRQLCSTFNALYIVKSRADIAYLTSANGVMLDSEDINVNDARKIISHDMIIGTSYPNCEADFILQDDTNFKSTVKILFIKAKDGIYTKKEG